MEIRTIQTALLDYWDVVKSSQRRIWSEVFAETRTRDILVAFLLIPAILLLVESVIRADYWVFQSITRADFRFHLIRDTIFTVDALWEAFISSFGHDNWETHLKPNLIAYLLVMLTIYPLTMLSARPTIIRSLFVWLLLTSPFVVGYMSFRYPMGRTSIGFSGTIGAFYGVLPVILLNALDNEIEGGFHAFWSVIMMFGVYTAFFVVLGDIVLASATTGVCLLFGIALIYVEGTKKTSRALETLLSLHSFPFVFAVVVALFGPIALFFVVGEHVNVVGHLAGYMWGFICGFIVLGRDLSVESRPSD